LVSRFYRRDGSFDINIRDTNLDGSGRERTELRMRIEQRKTDPITGESYQPVLESIAQALEVVLNVNIRNSGESSYVIKVSSPAKLSLIIGYLDKFPLFSPSIIGPALRSPDAGTPECFLT
jgi:hypothetical protein